MQEIGSEFWLQSDKYEVASQMNKVTLLGTYASQELFFLGRVALAAILDDLLTVRSIKTAYIPSYCCDSMIQPFIKRKIKVKYYDVYYEDEIKYSITEQCTCDLFLAMNYFGSRNKMLDEYIELFKNRDVIVVEDITHTLLNQTPCNEKSDYVIASIRKWLPLLSGGFACKMKGAFYFEKRNKVNEELINIRKQAMRHKALYIENGLEALKSTYLKEFALYNEGLNQVADGTMMDEYSKYLLSIADFKEIKEKRIRNMEYLAKGIKHIKGVKEVCTYQLGECPLFYPIYLEYPIRKDIQRRLAEHQIYCPIHWPIPNESCRSNLYDRELSLICDQRYGVEEMDSQLQLLHQILGA